MPTFDFKCKDCGHVFEHWWRSMRTKVLHPKCPKCGSKKTEKQYSHTHNIIVPPWH
jgi:putative FmdB family regulatory protein